MIQLEKSKYESLKKVGLALLSVILACVIIFCGYYIYLALHYYRIPDNQRLKINNNQSQLLKAGRSYKATTYNVGFGAYNHDFDFFMDSGQLKDGKKLQGASRDSNI